MNTLSRIAAIALKELRQLRRDRLTFGMIIGVPLMQMILFGYAINTDVRHLPAGVADLAQTHSSRALVAAAEASQVADVVYRARTASELLEALRRGQITIGIVIPEDFERRMQDHRRTAAQILVDGSDPVILSAASQLAQMPPPSRIGIASPTAPRIFEIRAYYNPERRSPVQIVPGLIGVILTMTMVLFTAVAIVRERERGNLEFLITTPVRVPELMAGKILPYVFIGLVQTTLVVLLGSFLFRVPIRGDLVDLYGAALVFICASLSMGLLVSTAAQNQFQAMQLTFFFFLPSILLSGFMFPFSGMPPFAQHIGEVLPLTHFVRLFRGILLRAATLRELAPELRPLILFTAVTFGLAVLRFRKRLD